MSTCLPLQLSFADLLIKECIWVGNISPSVSDAQLCEHFRPYGDITYERDNSNQTALIFFRHKDNAQKALESTHGQQLMGSKLQVQVQ